MVYSNQTLKLRLELALAISLENEPPVGVLFFCQISDGSRQGLSAIIFVLAELNLDLRVRKVWWWLLVLRAHALRYYLLIKLVIPARLRDLTGSRAAITVDGNEHRRCQGPGLLA
jgi:hypothetical protein